MGRKAIDELGNIYGRLTVMQRVPTEEAPDKRNAYWNCECQCGNEIIVSGAHYN